MITLTKKMKVIDLYNKIANGESVPKEIKVKDLIYHYDETDCNEFYRYRTMLNEFLTDFVDLNDEVEIIVDTSKEDKKIEQIKAIKDNDDNNFLLNYDNKKYVISVVDAIMLDKINEIIDKINGE